MAKFTKVITRTATAALLSVSVVSVAHSAAVKGGGGGSRSSSTAASRPAPAPRPVAAPAAQPRGIPSGLKPRFDPRPTDAFQEALRNPIKPAAPPAPPPVKIENTGQKPSQTIISPTVPVGRDTFVTPSATVTPPSLTPGSSNPSLDGAGVTIRNGPQIQSQ